MRKKILLFVLSVKMLNIAFSQQNSSNLNSSYEVAKMQFVTKQVIPPSPEAAELGKYGNVPVGLYTGTPNISIPLYEIKGNKISLPISLSYNASGFKPQDMATWVGSAWSFNAGGLITRSVLGNPDNDENYFGHSEVLNPPPYSNIAQQYIFMTDIQGGYKEAQPDIFFYNFAGHTGKFLIKPDGSVFKKQRDFKKINSCITCVTSSFTIVDENGITYIFNQLENTQMIPVLEPGDVNTHNYNFPSSWYLSLMYKDDERIEFEYYSSDLIQYPLENPLENEMTSLTYGCKIGMPGCQPITVFDLQSVPLHPPYITIQDRKFLKKIIFKKSNNVVLYVDILSATGQRLDSYFQDERRLNGLKVYSVHNGANKLIKQYDLSQSYFGDLPMGKKRLLRLDSVKEISPESPLVHNPAFNFFYNLHEAVPDFNTTSLDHWGFYNSSNNTSLIPSYYFYGGNGTCSFPAMNIGNSANREPTLSGSSLTLLNKIQYPTGGYTLFEYDLNHAVFDDHITRPVGGVRLKKMTDNDGQKSRFKVFSYTDNNGLTSGRAGLYPEYKKETQYLHYNVPVACAPGSNNSQSCCVTFADASKYTLYTIQIMTRSLYGLGTFQGSHVGYSKVAELQVDSSTNQPLGKTVYNYNISGYSEFDDDVSNGKLIKTSYYDINNKLLVEDSFSYNWQQLELLPCYMVKAKDLQTNKEYYCKQPDGHYLNYGVWETPPTGCVVTGHYKTKLFLDGYSIRLQNERLEKQIHKEYDKLSNNYKVLIKNYSYENPNHDLPTAIEEINTHNEKIVTTIRYAADYGTGYSGYNSMAYRISQLKQANLGSLPIEKLQYRQNADGSNKRYISGQITDYNKSGNPLNIYFLESRPLLTQINHSQIVADTFSYDNHYQLAATLSYNSGGDISNQQKLNDIPTSYIWDYNGLYPVAEAIGINDFQFSYTSFETSSKGGFIFSGNALTMENCPTGKKCYNLASGNLTGNIDPSSVYVLSYWSKQSQPYTVSSSFSVEQGITLNGWTFFEHLVSGASVATITGSSYIDEVRLYKSGAVIKTYTYEPGIGITSICDENNRIVNYFYDTFNRLRYIKDAEGNIISSNKYNYGHGLVLSPSQPTLFYNEFKEQSFIKNNGCPIGAIPTSVIYKVPYGKYVSSSSQVDADIKALAEISANGQAYANTQGQCLWYNVQLTSARLFRNNCTPEQGLGMWVRYTIPAGTYSSSISQADADAKAVADINTNGQAYANATATCSCMEEGKKMVNGVCETGNRVEYGYTMNANGTYTCIYIYSFSDGSQSGYYYYTSTTRCPLPE